MFLAGEIPWRRGQHTGQRYRSKQVRTHEAAADLILFMAWVLSSLAIVTPATKKMSFIFLYLPVLFISDKIGASP